MEGYPNREVEAGMQKATAKRKQVNRKVFRKKAIGPKIKITLWNSLIRSTMIYGLRAKELS